MASEYLKWKYRDVRPDDPVVLTKKQKAANWWHYHKWPVIIGVLVLASAVDILAHFFRLGEVLPDYQMAIVSTAPVSDAAISSLERSLENLGEDCSGDGRVLFQIHPYIDMSAAGENSSPQYAVSAQVRLMADMESCDSYFFLCSDCETLHANYQILAGADGALVDKPEDVCFYAWEDCPALAQLPLDPETAAEFSGLYLARRGFWQDRVCRNQTACNALWDILTEGAAKSETSGTP